MIFLFSFIEVMGNKFTVSKYYSQSEFENDVIDFKSKILIHNSKLLEKAMITSFSNYISLTDSWHQVDIEGIWHMDEIKTSGQL